MVDALFKVLPLALIGPIGVSAYLLREGYPALETAVASMTLFFLLMPYFGLGRTYSPFGPFGRLREDAIVLVKAILFYLAVYLFYAAGTHSFAWFSFGKLLLFLTVPALFLCLKPNRLAVTWLDLVAMIIVWLPFDMGWIKDIWLWPENKGAYVLNTIMATSYAVLLFAGYRRIQNIGYYFRLKSRDFRYAAENFALFFVIAIALGIYFDFIQYNGSTNWLKLIGAFFGIFLFIALPEELLFRGLFQNLLYQKLNNKWLSLIISSVVFGLTHLNNGPAPDWRYVMLATIAGFFYGRTYFRTKNLMAPAMVHAMVDAVWITFFMK